MTAAGVPSRFADRLLELLLSRGLACRLMVAAPQVLARITAMLAPGDLASELAVLDWGYETAVLTLARGGRPVFTRILRDCGFRRVTDSVASELGLNPQDVPPLLCRDGVADDRPSQGAFTLGPIDELVDDSLGRLRDELTRTLTHLRRQAAGAMPQQLLICGGGGTLHRVEQRLSACTRLPTSVWSGPSFGSGLGRLAPPACMTAPAAVLSAMRWNS